MVEKESNRRVVYVVKIGPLMKGVLEDQMESIKEATYDVCASSYWEAGEIIAKKILNRN